MENDIDSECAENSESMLDVSVISLCGRVIIHAQLLHLRLQI